MIVINMLITDLTRILARARADTVIHYAASFCPRSFDRAVMVAQWYDLRLDTRETRVRTLPWASSGHVTTRMLTFATKKLSTGANAQKEDAASFFCPRSFDRAVM